MSHTTIGALSLFTAAFLYGSQNIATRIAGFSYGPFVSTALRAMIVVVVLAWFVKWKKIKNKDRKWFILRAIGNVTATSCLFIAINKMSIGAALFSFYASMILSGGLFGVLFYKEKVSVIKAISLSVTGIGLLFMYGNQSQLVFNWYFAVAVVGGVGCSLWSIFSRPIAHYYSLRQLVVVDSAITVLFALLLSFASHESWQTVNFQTNLLPIFYLGLTQVFTGQLVARGFKSIDAQVGSTIMLNDTIIGMILAAFVFREIPSLLVLTGGVFIFTASVIPIIFRTKKIT